MLALEGIVAGGGLDRRPTQGLGRDVGGARVRRRRGRVRRARRGRRRERGARGAGTRKRQRHAGRGDGARRRGRAGDRPGHVDRRLRVPLLDRPPGRGAGQRPARHGRAGRARVRDPLARPRAQGQRRGRARDPGRRPAAVLGRAADPRARRRRACTRSASTPATPAARPRSRARADDPARGVDHGARRCSRSRSRSASSPPRSSRSRSPRTRPTTSASRATSSRAAGLVSDALWSYGTPPLVFPRPAFEVWLPLPSLLAAIPMALSGAGRADPARDGDARGARSCRSSPARSSRVLAWRLAADVAVERGAARSAGRGRSPSGPGSPRRSTCRCCSTRPCPTRRCCSARSSSARALLMTRVAARPARRPAAGRPPPRDRPAHRRSRR